MTSLREIDPDASTPADSGVDQRDAFTPSGGYPNGLSVDAIPLRDRVWLSMSLQRGSAIVASPS